MLLKIQHHLVPIIAVSFLLNKERHNCLNIGRLRGWWLGNWAQRDIFCWVRKRAELVRCKECSVLIVAHWDRCVALVPVVAADGVQGAGGPDRDILVIGQAEWTISAVTMTRGTSGYRHLIFSLMIL